MEKVEPGVTKGTVLDAVFILLYINNLPASVTSHMLICR